MQVATVSVMALRTGLGVFLTLSLLTSNVFSVEGLSKSNALVNNSDTRVIKTLKTEHGDVYDCVDFYKQPAFDHPALKNHDFHPQMLPSVTPKKTSSTQSYPNNPKTLSFGLKDKACPPGTVPIAKTKKNVINEHVNVIGPTVERDGRFVAFSRSKRTVENYKYHGVSANLTIHKPRVTGNDYSSGKISIKNEPDSIQVGWMVYPSYYKDDNTRLFIYTDAAGQSCFNTDCPGFVIARSDIPLDSVLAPFSESSGPFSSVSFSISQDPATQNWWLKIGPDDTPIGFWPKQIFTNMADVGTYVECGGDVYHDPTAEGSVQMGNGYKPSRNAELNAYCNNFEIINIHNEVDIVRDTEAYSNNGAYGVEDHYNVEGSGDDELTTYEHVVIYGGTQMD